MLHPFFTRLLARRTASSKRLLPFLIVLLGTGLLPTDPAVAAGKSKSASSHSARPAAAKPVSAAKVAARKEVTRAVPGRAAPAPAARARASAAPRATPSRQAVARGRTAAPVRAAATPRTASNRRGRLVRVSAAPAIAAIPSRPSIGQAIGLHDVEDPLELRSAVAYAIDQRTGEPLFEKNIGAVLPIASISKVMTAMVVMDADLPMDEELEVTQEDVDTERYSSSRLRVGSRLTRAEMLHAALMASENRAANALGRHYPGGMPAFVSAMNAKAASLGMIDSRFSEPTGLSSQNVANAVDLARMVKAAADYPLIRRYSTSTGLTVDNGHRNINFHNTNRLVDNPDWMIGLQKTGYISEAGNCLVMQSSINGRPVILVLLDAAGRSSRFADAERLKRWIEDMPMRAGGRLEKITQSSSALGS